MLTGLTRQALRRHPWSLIGTFTTQTMAAALVSAALSSSETLQRARSDAQIGRALADSGILELAQVLVVVAVYLTALVVALTMATSIGRQRRDLALARAVGAAPGQVRRAVAAQAGLVAVPAVVFGAPAGFLLGQLWLAGLTSKGAIPSGVSFQQSPVALPAALGIVVVTSLLGSGCAGFRVSRMPVAAALTETATSHHRAGALRLVVGLLLGLVGVALSIRISWGDPEQADGGALLVLLLFCVAAGFLGPGLLRITAPLARVFGGSGALAADNLAVQARALSGALVPLVLALAFTTIKVAEHSTSAQLHGRSDPAPGLWTDYSGTAVYAAFAAVAALNTLVTVLLARRRELAVLCLVGGSRTRVLGILACEALLVTWTGVLLAAGVATATLLPMLHAALGTWHPYLPLIYIVGGLVGVLGMVTLGTVVPAAMVLRRNPVAAVTVDP